MNLALWKHPSQRVQYVKLWHLFPHKGKGLPCIAYFTSVYFDLVKWYYDDRYNVYSFCRFIFHFGIFTKIMVHLYEFRINVKLTNIKFKATTYLISLHFKPYSLFPKWNILINHIVFATKYSFWWFSISKWWKSKRNYFHEKSGST